MRTAWYGCAALTAALSVGCSGDPEPEFELGVVRQAVTFPPTASWVAVQQTGINLGDPSTDGANNGREVVGSSAFRQSSFTLMTPTFRFACGSTTRRSAAATCAPSAGAS